MLERRAQSNYPQRASTGRSFLTQGGATTWCNQLDVRGKRSMNRYRETMKRKQEKKNTKPTNPGCLTISKKNWSEKSFMLVCRHPHYCVWVASLSQGHPPWKTSRKTRKLWAHFQDSCLLGLVTSGVQNFKNFIACFLTSSTFSPLTPCCYAQISRWALDVGPQGKTWDIGW